MLETANTDRYPQDQQGIAKNCANDRGTHHIYQPLSQRQNADDQFRSIAKRSKEQSSNSFTCMFRDLLDRLPNQRRKRNDTQARYDENQERQVRKQQVEQRSCHSKNE